MAQRLSLPVCFLLQVYNYYRYVKLFFFDVTLFALNPSIYIDSTTMLSISLIGEAGTVSKSRGKVNRLIAERSVFVCLSVTLSNPCLLYFLKDIHEIFY